MFVNKKIVYKFFASFQYGMKLIKHLISQTIEGFQFSVIFMILSKAKNFHQEL